MIDSRKTEIVYKTNDPKRMLNKYLVNNLYRKWTDEYFNETTGRNETIERSELILSKGTLITNEIIPKIRFFIEEGGIDEVEVSNQKRMAYIGKNEDFYPYMAQVQIKDKKYKMLFYATSVKNAIDILNDYIELNYEGMFNIIMVKEFDNCVVLLDTFKEARLDIDAAFLKGELTAEEYLTEVSRQIDKEENAPKIDFKWYKILSRIVLRDNDGDENESSYTFVVKSTSAERANMLINIHLKMQQDEQAKKAVANGKEYEKKDIVAAIEESSIIPVGCFIPKEFSEVYKD